MNDQTLHLEKNWNLLFNAERKTVYVFIHKMYLYILAKVKMFKLKIESPQIVFIG